MSSDEIHSLIREVLGGADAWSEGSSWTLEGKKEKVEFVYVKLCENMSEVHLNLNFTAERTFTYKGFALVNIVKRRVMGKVKQIKRKYRECEEKEKIKIV